MENKKVTTKKKRFSFRKKFRGADELFSSGKIFDAKDKELDNILKDLTTRHNTNNISQHRDMIRAITVLGVKSNKSAENAQFFNIIFSIIIVGLTFFTYMLMTKQTEYAEMSTRDQRIRDYQEIQRAVEYCTENPDAEDSGVIYTSSGKPAPCSDVIKRDK